MKKTRIFIVFLIATIMLSGIYASTSEAQAPDLSMWNGSLWQIKQTVKGLYWGAGSPRTTMGRNIAGSDTAYGILNADGEGLTLTLYEYMKGQPVCEKLMTIPFTYLVGSSVDLVGKYIAEDDPPGMAFNAGLVRFTGTNEGGVITKGKVASIGAFSVQEGFDTAGDLVVLGLVIKGKVIKENQLKCQIP